MTLEQQIAELRAQVAAMANRLPVTVGVQRQRADTNIIRQVAHGLIAGNIVRHNGTSWVKSQADTSANAVVGGVVLRRIGADAFELWTGGYAAGFSGFTAGSIHYLHATIPGYWTTTPPAIPIPVFFADSTGSGILLNGVEPARDSYRDLDWEYVSILSSGTSYAIPSGAEIMRFVLMGAGGGGGGSKFAKDPSMYVATTSGGSPTRGLLVSAYGGDGGSGAALILDLRVKGITSLSYALGAAGTAGNSATPTDGGTGGNTTITINGFTWTSPGGLGGKSATEGTYGVIAGQGGDGGRPRHDYTRDDKTISAIPLSGRAGMSGGSALLRDSLNTAHAHAEPRYTQPPYANPDNSTDYGRGGRGGISGTSGAAGEAGAIYVFKMK